ncbi:basic phospholipase A2 PA-9C-like [Tubulanus polymorphus]|uniref:basic phospholipase A2 PA-9C-like n=1 Tax=Tubulanus polymorphus TaxID=672921 RepID=UPI003DA326F1
MATNRRCRAYGLATAMAMMMMMFSLLVNQCLGNSLQLLEMLECVHTGHDATDYNGYGRYCGLGNCGGEPVDAIDKCCQNHDNCYGKVTANGGSCRESWDTYFLNYKMGGKCTSCAPVHAYDATDPDAKCKHGVCRCDRALTLCLKRHKHNYNSKNMNKCSATKKGFREIKTLFKWVIGE